MSANKEAVIAEKELSCRFGQEVLVGYSEPIHSEKYPSFEEFVREVQQQWDAQWKRVYSADWSSECLSPAHWTLLRAACCITDSLLPRTLTGRRFAAANSTLPAIMLTSKYGSYCSIFWSVC
jgi:hypothetical protein